MMRRRVFVRFVCQFVMYVTVLLLYHSTGPGVEKKKNSLEEGNGILTDGATPHFFWRENTTTSKKVARIAAGVIVPEPEHEVQVGDSRTCGTFEEFLDPIPSRCDRYAAGIGA